MSFSIKADYRDARKLLNGLRRNVRDARAGWLAMAPIYYQHVSQNFRQEGIPDKWAPLRPNTLRRRRQGKNRKNPKARILQDTGLLRKAAATPGGPHSILSVSLKRMIIGTSLKYAGHHQTGTPNMKARPIYTITREVLGNMSTARLKQIMRNAKR